MANSLHFLQGSVLMALEIAMGQRLYCFWIEDEGQDLIEYTLLMTFIVMAVFALLGSGRPAVNAIWTTANSELVSGNNAATGG